MKKIDDTKCWISHTLPVGMLNGAATVEKILAIFFFSFKCLYIFIFYKSPHFVFPLFVFFQIYWGDNY